MLAGFLAFEAVVLIFLLAARTGWAAYADAEPTRAYSLGMFLARLVVGALATVVGGLVTARLDRGTRQVALMFGVLLLLISVVWHVRIWDQYPVWYHLSWFACIVPASLIGGRLAGGRSRYDHP